MKRKVGLLLVIVLLVGIFVGCTGEEETGLSIGIVQIVEHPSLDTIRESIVGELATLGYKVGENLNINYQNAQGDQSNLNSICQKFVNDKVDLIIAIATPSAQAAAAATKDIPIIFSAVTDPVAAKLVADPAHPAANITGTSDAIPVDQVFDLAKDLTPNVKKIGFLYTASEANSKSVIDEAKKIAAKDGFEYEEMTITNTSELQQAAETLIGKVDAIYTPIDNTIASAMPVLATVGKKAGKPVYVGADSMVADGGYATVGINYEDLGKKTAEMVNDVLRGKSISEIPVATLDQFQKVINKTTAKAIGAPESAEGALIVE
ncbi:MAG: ABC transporter substrate binding protein [Cellulosilyticaceae bacterium]